MMKKVSFLLLLLLNVLGWGSVKMGLAASVPQYPSNLTVVAVSGRKSTCPGLIIRIMNWVLKSNDHAQNGTYYLLYTVGPNAENVYRYGASL